MYSWYDFECDADMAGGGDPEKFFLTIAKDGEEYAVIVHRVCGGKYPLDGDIAEQKRKDAQYIVDALNFCSTLPVPPSY